MQHLAQVAVTKANDRIKHDYTPPKPRFFYPRRSAPGCPVEVVISGGIEVFDKHGNKIDTLVIEINRDQHRAAARDFNSLWFSGDDK